MKVVHINTYDGNGGAGRAVLRLNRALNSLGVDSKVLCLYQFDPHSGVKAISNSLTGRIKAVFNIFAERYLVKPYLKGPGIPFSLQRFGVSLSDIAMLQEADIIHIHWVNHGFLNSEGLQKLSVLNKKVFWSIHDANPLTGGCHVRYGCPGFLNECGNCPALKDPSDNDLSHRTWALKKKAYEALDFSFIAPSTWMGQCATNSSLGKEKRVRVISNALETNVFRPLDKMACRREFNVDPDAQVILAGYMPSKADRHKGLPELRETLRHLAAHPGIERDRLMLLFYGSSGEGVDLDIPVKHRFMGRISKDEVLVKLYSLSDVFVFPSIEESMGYTALESLACGTPVAAFNTSGVTDVVQHGLNGYLAPSYDAKELADGVFQLLTSSERPALASAARSWAATNFSLETIARQHLDLYKEALGT